MTPSLDRHDEAGRRPRPLASPLPRAVANEYPAGYLAQLTRPFSARKDGLSRFAPRQRRAPAQPAGAASRSDR